MMLMILMILVMLMILMMLMILTMLIILLKLLIMHAPEASHNTYQLLHFELLPHTSHIVATAGGARYVRAFLLHVFCYRSAVSRTNL